MTDKIKELLAVLDMPEEDKQLVWLKEHREEFGIDNHPSSYPLEGFPRAARFFLADLAFRLRDEVFALKNGGNIWARGYIEVVKKIKPAAMELGCSVEWWNCCAKPDHWIIAALIAKELAKDGKE